MKTFGEWIEEHGSYWVVVIVFGIIAVSKYSSLGLVGLVGGILGSWGFISLIYYIIYSSSDKSETKKESKEPKDFLNKLTRKEWRFVIITIVLCILWILFCYIFLEVIGGYNVRESIFLSLYQVLRGVFIGEMINFHFNESLEYLSSISSCFL
jgi:TRAP-type C4-dicarboxylate transport system permease large subunit